MVAPSYTTDDGVTVELVPGFTLAESVIISRLAALRADMEIFRKETKDMSDSVASAVRADDADVQSLRSVFVEKLGELAAKVDLSATLTAKLAVEDAQLAADSADKAAALAAAADLRQHVQDLLAVANGTATTQSGSSADTGAVPAPAPDTTTTGALLGGAAPAPVDTGAAATTQPGPVGVDTGTTQPAPVDTGAAATTQPGPVDAGAAATTQPGPVDAGLTTLPQGQTGQTNTP